MQDTSARFEQKMKKFIVKKDLPQIRRLIIQACHYDIEYIKWTYYLVDIFAMLTDVTISLPSFQRRNIIFQIFKTALKIRIFQDKNQIHTNINVWSRCIKCLLNDEIAKVKLDQSKLTIFHKGICHILAFCGKFKKDQEYVLPQNQINTLRRLYPFPISIQKPKYFTNKVVYQQQKQIKNNPVVEFIIPDLMLWFEMSLQLQNVCSYKLGNNNLLSEHAINFKQKLLDLRQPILKIIFLYNQLQQAMKIYSNFNIHEPINENPNKKQELDLVGKKIIMAVVIQIRDRLYQYLQISYHQKQSKISLNVFYSLVKFNIIFLLYVFISKKIEKNNQFHKACVVQIKKLIVQIISPLCTRVIRNLDHSQNSLKQRLIKYEIQIKWIKFQLQFLQEKNSNLNFNQKIINNYSYKNFQRRNFWQLQVSQFRQLNSQKLVNFQKSVKDIFEKITCQSQMSALRQAQFSIIISGMLYYLNYNIQLLYEVLNRLLQPKQIVNLCSILIASYHIENQKLIIILVENALKVSSQYFKYPSSIKQHRDVQTIIKSVKAIRICKSSPSRILLCSICGQIQTAEYCQGCGQINYQVFAELSKMQHIWRNYLKIYQYFKKMQSKRLDAQIGIRLISQLSNIQNI